ncbi:MAG TPA: serine hydrolase domain-containing protein [Longimicrobiales bacterium]|nr:serine hydrolase domain-containing protein [Longimicrobiales bacterium]
MRRRRFLRLAALGTAFAGTLGSVDGSERRRARAAVVAQEDSRIREISHLIEAKMLEYRVPGVAFGLVKDGDVSMRGFGVTNLERPQPVTPRTVFPIASISKTVTATAMLVLHDRGLVDIEAPVTEYIPNFRIADERATESLRIWHLLTHTVGWEGQLAAPDRGPATLSYFIGSLRVLPALASPGEVWGYNNAAWAVAGGVIEVVARRPINDALRELVFEPLGLDHAFSRAEEAVRHPFAAAHQVIGDRTLVGGSLQLPTNVPAGGCATSLESLIGYARFHLGDGRVPSGERLLTEASLSAMRAPRFRKNSSTDEMGLGWHLRTLDGVLTAQHGGTLPGHSLHLQLVPERALCFAILTNSGGTASNSGGWRLNEDVAAALLELYEGISLAPNQRTGGNRGGNERMHLHAQPLETQPPLDELLGVYDREPFGRMLVRDVAGRPLIGTADAEFDIVFYAPDMAYATSEGPDSYEGMPIEFIRDAGGRVGWIRVDGRIARKV